jgi:hypothetical protein
MSGITPPVYHISSSHVEGQLYLTKVIKKNCHGRFHIERIQNISHYFNETTNDLDVTRKMEPILDLKYKILQ